MSLADAERILIEQTLASTGGNRQQAASILGIGERTLYRKINEFGLAKPGESEPDGATNAQS
jgi:two-component system response regulator HydG